MPKRSSIGQEADTKFRQHAPTSPQATRVHKNDAHTSRSEGDHDTLALLVATKLELLCSANALLLPCLALGALHTDRHLLRGLGLLVENRLCLPTEPGLLTVVPPLALGVEGRLAGLVLRDLVHLVLLALRALAECLPRLRDVHHRVPNHAAKR
eukprot:m.428845 g.428845  ORF g.428845 m.428845 type:complete len:154 (+) comp16890_c0_seq1:40-501(+)